MRQLILSSHDDSLTHQKNLEHLRLRRSISIENTEAGPDSVPLPKIKWRDQEFLTCQVRYTKRVKRVTLQRSLVSKVVHFPEKVSRLDFLILYDNLLYIQDLAARDENFRRKFGKSLEVLTKHLRGFRLTSKTSTQNVVKLSNLMKESLEGFYFPLRNTLTEIKKSEQMYRITPFISLGRVKKLLKPKAYIGKGYSDQGTAKVPSIDNSPSWQEVASKDLDGEWSENGETE